MRELEYHRSALTRSRIRAPRPYVTYVYPDGAVPIINKYGSSNRGRGIRHDKTNRTIVVGSGETAKLSIIWDPSFAKGGQDRRYMSFRDFTPTARRHVEPHGEAILPDGSQIPLPLKSGTEGWVELLRDLGHARYTFDNPYRQKR